MVPAIAEHADELGDLCRRYSVLRLDLFGSSAVGEYRPGECDLDFLVEFLPPALTDYADSYFGLLQELEELFGQPVDLVVGPAIRNPYFLQSVEKTKMTIYAT